ncbi:MAG: hypothetical protein R3325_03170 [Thermoanaerobaculia bacterium]|nr:hypothetical protein [Thermoanaerobaculia bacterium]
MTEVPRDSYDRIAAEIESADSPVGIDAKKTHVLILHKLEQIERRLERLERQTGGGGPGPSPGE